MKNSKTFYCIIVAYLFSTQLYSQAGGNLTYDRWGNVTGSNSSKTYNVPEATAMFPGDNNLELEVKAIMNVNAFSYLAIFNITQAGETAKMADEMVAKRLEGFINSLKTLEIKEDNIFIDMISMIPFYELEEDKRILSKTYNEVPKGFELQKNIHIKYNNPVLLDKMVTLAAENEIYDLVKVEYFVENQEAYFDTLRNRSVKLIKKKMKAFNELGFKNSDADCYFAEDLAVAFPIDCYSSYQAFNTTKMDKWQKHSKFKEARKQVSMYYKKIDYNEFDIVINPVYSEPVVQFTYHIRASYKIDKIEKNKEYLLISSDGNLKTINVE